MVEYHRVELFRGLLETAHVVRIHDKDQALWRETK